MKIPKRIEKMIDRRARIASDLNAIDSELAEWIEDNKIEVQEYDYCSGVEMYANPYASAERIKQAIERK